MGPVMAKAVFVLGEQADKNVPNETAVWLTRISMATKIRNRENSLFKLAIQ